MVDATKPQQHLEEAKRKITYDKVNGLQMFRDDIIEIGCRTTVWNSSEVIWSSGIPIQLISKCNFSMAMTICIVYPNDLLKLHRTNTTDDKNS